MKKSRQVTVPKAVKSVKKWLHWSRVTDREELVVIVQYSRRLMSTESSRLSPSALFLAAQELLPHEGKAIGSLCRLRVHLHALRCRRRREADKHRQHAVPPMSVPPLQKATCLLKCAVAVDGSVRISPAMISIKSLRTPLYKSRNCAGRSQHHSHPNEQRKPK